MNTRGTTNTDIYMLELILLFTRPTLIFSVSNFTLKWLSYSYNSKKSTRGTTGQYWLILDYVENINQCLIISDSITTGRRESYDSHLNNIEQYWIILDFTGLYWTLLDNIGQYWTIWKNTGCYGQFGNIGLYYSIF